MLKVSELKGYRSLRALNAFHTLLLGMKMLPQNLGESYEAFYKRFETLPEHEKITMLREAAFFVKLEEEEIEALVYFCNDKNGVPYGKHNIKNLGPDELIDVIVSVAYEIGKIKIDMVTEEEKKKVKNIDVRSYFLRFPDLTLEEVVNIAFYEAACIAKS